MHSHFSAQTLAEIFRDLYLSERSGVLALSYEEVEKRVYFERGLIVYADSSLEPDDLGTFLVQSSRLSAGALEEARQNVGDTRGLAQALINRDLIAKRSLAEAVREIVAQIVRSVFRWKGGTARFTEGPSLPDQFEGDVLATFEVILNGIFEMSGFGPIHEAMLGLDNRLKPRQPAPLPIERLKLSPAHGFVFSRVDAATSVKEVVSILPPGEEEQATRFLFGMLVMGVIDYEPPVGDGPFRVANILRDHADRRALERMQERTIRQAYEQMRQQNPYEILGVSPPVSREAVERAYEEAKALFSRDRILPTVRDEFRAELTVIESRLIEAFLKLSQPEPVKARKTVAAGHGAAEGKEIGVDDLLVRVELEKTRGKLAAEKASSVADAYFAQARRAIREGDYHNAIQYGKLAISYNDQDARYYFMVADCQSRNPDARWQRMAEENYTRASELDPWNADYFLRLGHFYKRRGLKLRARKQFEEALKLVPAHEEATRELERLG